MNTQKLHEYLYPVTLIALVGLIGIMTFLFSGLHSPLNFNFGSTYTSSIPEQIPTATIQSSDLKIAQYNERPAQHPHVAPLSVSAPAVVLVPGCSLSFSIIPFMKTIFPAGTVNYSILVKNNGLEICRNTSFSIYYADNESFVSAVPKSSGGNYWRVGDLKSGGSYSVSVATKNILGGGNSQIHTEACATADNSADVCADSLVFVLSGMGINLPVLPTFTPKPSATPTASPTPSSTLAPSATPQPSPKAPATPTPTPVPSSGDRYPVPKGEEFGTWIWDSPMQITSNAAGAMLSAAQANGMNSVYITIDDYLDIVALPEGADKDAQKKSYLASLSQFISTAKSKGIAVDAEGGWRDWAEMENRWKGYALIDFVKEYNQKNPTAKIRNFQYDVEPYLLATYETNKAAILQDFIAFIDESAIRMQTVDAGFSVVIPHFYDSLQKWTPVVVYQDKSAYTYTHLLKVLEKKKGSTIIIMAYRDFFDGANGTREISEAEIKEASSGGYSTKVIVAQETGNVQPDYVTFYGQPKSDLYGALDSIYGVFGQYANFGGAAVHYLDTFLALQ